MTLPPDFEVPADWQPAIDRITDIIYAAGWEGVGTVVIPTRDVGNRPGTADGVAGGYTFAQAVTAHIDRLAADQGGNLYLKWTVVYDHNERCFLAVNRAWIRLTTRPQG